MGFFHYAVLNDTMGSTDIELHGVRHGVADFGGGVDLRLVKSVSLRSEVRDYVTAAGLDGAPGRQHLLPLIGLAFYR